MENFTESKNRLYAVDSLSLVCMSDTLHKCVARSTELTSGFLSKKRTAALRRISHQTAVNSLVEDNQAPEQILKQRL